MLNIDGDSYRMRSHRARAEATRKAGGKLMTSVAACPICGTPRPANRIGDGPWCCSLVCYRAFHGIDQPEASSSHEQVTTTCPVCQRPFKPIGLRAYCSEACRVAAYRRRRNAERPPVVVPTATTPRRPITVYECDGCGVRAVGEQRCPDCATFMRRIGIGGCCPRGAGQREHGLCVKTRREYRLTFGGQRFLLPSMMNPDTAITFPATAPPIYLLARLDSRLLQSLYEQGACWPARYRQPHVQLLDLLAMFGANEPVAVLVSEVQAHAELAGAWWLALTCLQLGAAISDGVDLTADDYAAASEAAAALVDAGAV